MINGNMKDVRLNLTANEKMAQQVVGIESNSNSFNMNEKNIDTLIRKEKENKFNQEVDDYVEKFSKHIQGLKETQ